MHPYSCFKRVSCVHRIATNRVPYLSSTKIIHVEKGGGKNFSQWPLVLPLSSSDMADFGGENTTSLTDSAAGMGTLVLSIAYFPLPHPQNGVASSGSSEYFYQ